MSVDEQHPGYAEWEARVSDLVKSDGIWKTEAYRLALFAADLGWGDVGRLSKDARTVSIASQLYRALGSIVANFAEGYSRSSGRDRVRFYEYALGSARESIAWYHLGRDVLSDAAVNDRHRLLISMRRLLLSYIRDQRDRRVCGLGGLSARASRAD
jgi:four helix bundle protein